MATVVSQFENVLSQLQHQAAPVAPMPPRPVPAMSKSHTVVTTQKTLKFFQQNKSIIILAALLIVAIVIWGVRAYLLKKAKAKEEETTDENADEEFSSFFKDKPSAPMAPRPAAPLAAPPPTAFRAALSQQQPSAAPSGPVVQQPSQVPLPPRPLPPAPPQQQPFDAVIKLDSSSAIPVVAAPQAKKIAAESEERPGSKRGEKEAAIPGSDVGGTPKPPPGQSAPGGSPADPQFTAL